MCPCTTDLAEELVLLHDPARFIYMEYNVGGGPQCRWTTRLSFHSRGLIIAQAT